jgi:hypothetical protein
MGDSVTLIDPNVAGPDKRPFVGLAEIRTGFGPLKGRQIGLYLVPNSHCRGTKGMN